MGRGSASMGPTPISWLYVSGQSSFGQHPLTSWTQGAVNTVCSSLLGAPVWFPHLNYLIATPVPVLSFVVQQNQLFSGLHDPSLD